MNVPRASARRWPFAVGLVLTSDTPAGSADGVGDAGWSRLAVALAAHEAGFYLLDVVEVASRTGVTAGDRARLWFLAARTDADAVFVLGLEAVERKVLDPMADELRLVIRVVPADSAGPPTSGAGDRTGSGGHRGELFAPWTTEM